jgi:four helix bundle protein
MKIVRHQELDVYKRSFAAALKIFEIGKAFPPEEKYSLTDQIRRSSRSVSANLAEAWRKLRYEAAFILKLNDCEGESAETQTWIEFAVKCGYLDRDTGRQLYKEYDEIISMLTSMIANASKWVLPTGRRNAK